jgi:hypothetical protein
LNQPTNPAAQHYLKLSRIQQFPEEKKGVLLLHLGTADGVMAGMPGPFLRFSSKIKRT